MAETFISNVFIITTDDSLLYDGDTDETVSVGNFTYLSVDYSYTVFKRGIVTCLHVFGASIDRNVYFKFNHTFESETDLDMATIFLEPPLDSEVNNSDVVSGFTRETAPIMTGISEVPSSSGSGIIIVHEDPLDYHVRLTEYTTTGAFATSDGSQLYYRALSRSGNSSTHTKIIVLEASTGRKLYFTVNRSTFDEQLDMDTAQFLLRRVEGKQASFNPAVTEEEFSRLMDVYSSTDNASLAATTITRPSSAPTKRVSSSTTDPSSAQKRPSTAVPNRTSRGSFGSPSLPTISEQPSSIAFPAGSDMVPIPLAGGGGSSSSSSIVMSIKAATSAASMDEMTTVWSGAPSRSETMVIAKPTQRTAADKCMIQRKYDRAKVSEVHMLTKNREFEHAAATDGVVRAGSMVVADLLYLYRAFSRPSTRTTYLTVFGVSSERTVRFRIPREQFVSEEDIKAVTSFLVADSGDNDNDDDDDGPAGKNTSATLALTQRSARKTSAGGGAVAAGLLRCQVCKAPVTGGLHDSRSRGMIGDQQQTEPAATTDFRMFLANVENDEPQQPPPQSALPILSGVVNLGDMVVFEEPRKYHPIPHRTIVRGTCTLDLGDPPGAGREKSIINNNNNTIACSYRATSSGGQTQVVVSDESSALRRKLYFTVERGEAHSTLLLPRGCYVSDNTLLHLHTCITVTLLCCCTSSQDASSSRWT